MNFITSAVRAPLKVADAISVTGRKALAFVQADRAGKGSGAIMRCGPNGRLA
jgi:hypothetical protein